MKFLMMIFFVLSCCSPVLAVITTENSRNDYIGNGAVSVYPYTFKIFKASDLQVIRRDDNGVETVLSPGTNYSVSGVKNKNGGNVTLTAPLANNYKLVIKRVTEIEQNADIRNQGDYYPDYIEDALDSLTMNDQTLAEQVKRSLKVSPTTPSNFDPTLPAVLGANQMLMIDENGLGLQLGPTPQQISDSVAAVAAAQAAAAAAAASEAAAELAETNATAAATAAGNSANDALDAQMAAETAEFAAQGHATNAQNSATAAAAHDILYGSGVPSNGIGVNGNSYIDQDTGTFYLKTAGAWVEKVTLTGSGGVASFNGRSGAVMPEADDYDKNMVGLGNVDNTSDATKNAAVAILTNKTIDGDLNTITNIQLDSSVIGVLGINHGGTGENSAEAGFNALQPMTAAGDLIYGGTGGDATVLPIGTDGQVLTITGGVPVWGVGGGGTASPLTTKGDLYTYGTDNARLPVGTDGQVLIADSAETLGIKWAPAPSGLPAITPVTDQGKTLIVNTSNAPEWQTKLFAPAGGTANQVLAKVNSADGNYAWTTINTASVTAFGDQTTPRTIAAATGITAAASHMTTTGDFQTLIAKGPSAGMTAVTANPQIQAHTKIGSRMTIIGGSNTDGFSLATGNGLNLNGPWNSYQRSVLELQWDGVVWVETDRREP